MYATEVNDRKLTLGVSGMLWNRSLVMYDRETSSLWSHILGEAMQGTMAGTRLEIIPSVMTDWQTWRTDHPQGTVVWMKRTSDRFRTEFYRKPDAFLLGITDHNQAKAWRYDTLARTPVVNDNWGDEHVVVVFVSASATARLYSRRLGDRTLTFTMRNERIIDRETGTVWEPTTGRAIEGTLAGQYLNALPAVVSYTSAWLSFHPRSEIK